MAYHVKIKKSAEKELQKLPLDVILAIKPNLIALANNPFPTGHKKLHGFKSFYRIRAGNYRVIYSIDHLQRIVEVLKIGDRKDIYK